MPQLKAPDGSIVFVPDDQATHLLAQGYAPAGSSEAGAALTKPEDTQGGIGGGISAGLTSAASGATLGLSDVALAGILNKGDLEAVRQAREDHPIVTGLGQLAGALGPGFVAPESLLGGTPSGLLSHAASGLTEGAKAAGGLKALAGVTAIGGAEGSLQSAGMYISDVALGDRDLSAEGLSGALGRGFVFGGVASGGMLGIEKGTMAARRLFARVAEGGAGAAGDAAATFDRKLDETLTAHEDTADIARKRLDEIRQMKSEASAAKMRADAELAQAKLEAFQGRNAPAEVPVEAPAAPAPEAPATPRMPETAGPAGETQVSQTSSARPPATGSLEDQLAATKAGLDQGATIQDLNAARAARGTTVTGPLGSDVAAEEQKLSDALGTYEQRRAKVDEWVARIKNPRTKYTAEGTAESIGAGLKPAVRGRLTKALDEDVFVEQSGGNIRTIGKGEHSLEDLTPNSRILARSNGETFSKGAQLDELYQDAIERAGLAENAAEREAALHEAADVEQQIHEHVRDIKPENAAVIDKINEVRAAAGRTGYHAAFARAERRAMDAASAVEGKLGKIDPEAEAFYQENLASAAPRQPVSASFLKDAEEQGYTMRAAKIAEERLKKGMPAIADEQLARIVRPPVEPVHEAAQVIGDYEKAAADLVEAVGPAAPPAAQQATAAYRAAEDAADRKLIDRTTRAVDDHVSDRVAAPPAAEPPPGESYGPYEEYKPVGRNPKERAASAREVKLGADAQLSKLKIEEATLKEQLPARKAASAGKAKLAPEVVTPPPSSTATPPTRLQRALHIADKVGQGLEVANMAGIPGLPKPSDLPVVGPILGAFLKFRALTGKLSGRIAASGDAKAAALAARTRDRAAQAIDRMLGLAEKAAPTARTVAVATTTRTGEMLIKRYFDDGHPDAPEGAPLGIVAAARVREITAAAASPQAVIAQVRQQLKDVSDPDLIASAEQQKLREVQYLAANAPKLPPDNPFAPRQAKVSAPDAQSLARRLEVIDDPVSALEQVEKKCLTPEAAEALRICYPKLFAEVQQRLMSRASEIKASIPYETRVRMTLLCKVPLDRTLDPETITTLQAPSAVATTSPAAPQQNAPPVPSTAGPVNLASLYETASDRRAARR